MLYSKYLLSIWCSQPSCIFLKTQKEKYCLFIYPDFYLFSCSFLMFPVSFWYHFHSIWIHENLSFHLEPLCWLWILSVLFRLRLSLFHLYYLKKVFNFKKFFGHKACGILAPQPRVKSMPPALGVQSLNHWTIKEVSSPLFL